MEDFPEVFERRPTRPALRRRSVFRGAVNYGEWNTIIRTIAGWDVGQYDVIWNTWPVREGLITYVAALRRFALEEFYHELDLYVAGGLKAAPKLPRILRDGNWD